MSMYYRDPDGNIIETQYDTMSVDDADAFLGSEAYVINPIGVDFDPEDLSRRLEAGEELSTITKRPNIGTRGLDTVPQ